MPPGYKIDFNERKQTMIMTEMVPTAQSVQNWTEMVTVQIFLGLKSTPAEFRTRMEKLWSGACPAGSGNIVSSASENGYATLLWRQSCPLNKATGKPGDDVVQGNRRQ